MPLSTQCIYNGQTISIDEALRIKQTPAHQVGSMAFICPECGSPVRPHQAGGDTTAHFEHIARAPSCSLSHKARSKDNNPDWMRDELIVALDCYLRHRPNPPGKSSKEIADLSITLRKLGARLHPFVVQSPTFRNTNGVYMKLMNFRRLDPTYTVSQSSGTPKKGLQRGAAGDESVWSAFAHDPARCSEVAKAIIAGIDYEEGGDPTLYIPDDVEEAPEGRLLTRTHIVRERAPSLVAAKIRKAMQTQGKLECEVCKFDYSKKYGARGEGYIECHHTLPLATLIPGAKTKIKDLALVCSNCHRMIHRKKEWLSIKQLQELLKS